MLKQIASDHSHLCSQFSRNINANLTFAENAILNLFNISLTNFKWTIVVCLGSGQNYFTRTDVTKPQNRWWSLPILPSSTTTALTPLARSKKKCWSLLLVLALAPRGFSPGTPVFPSPQKPTLLNSNSTWKVSPISALR